MAGSTGGQAAFEVESVPVALMMPRLTLALMPVCNAAMQATNWRTTAAADGSCAVAESSPLTEKVA